MKRARIGDRQVSNRARSEAAALLCEVEPDDDLEFLEESENLVGRSPNNCADFQRVSPNYESGSNETPADKAAASSLALEHSLNISQSPERPIVISKPTRLSEVFSDYQSESNESGPEVDTTFVQQVGLKRRLQEWYINSNVNLSQLQSLLNVLRPDHPDLPKDARTIAQTPRTVPHIEKKLDNGTYIHIGLESGLRLKLESGLKKNSNTLKINFNVNGLSVSKSSNLHVWPILGCCKDLVDDEPFTIGVFCGAGAPKPLQNYLEDFVSEMKQIQNDGVIFNGMRYTIIINCFILDTPARAHLKQIKGHRGAQSCERCIQEGETVGHYYCYETEASAPRTDDAFARMEYDDEHQTGLSPLLQLNVKLVSQVVLDPMHLLFLGVTRRFLKHLIKPQFPTGAKLSALEINNISLSMLSLRKHIPSDFVRVPRSLEFLSRWKATELRLFVLYLATVVLKDKVKQEVYDLFLLFVVACRIIASKKLSSDMCMLDYAEKLLATFVKHCADNSVFGPTFVSINVHNLLHIVDDVRSYGDITEFDAFPFENHLRIINGMIRSGAKVVRQIVNRLSERDLCYQCPESKLLKLTPFDYDRLSEEFACLRSSSFSLCPGKEKDSYFFVEGAVCHLKKIVKIENKIMVLADLNDDLENFFLYPTESKRVGIFKVCRWTKKDFLLPVDAIQGKVLFLPFQNFNVAIHILHTL